MFEDDSIDDFPADAEFEIAVAANSARRSRMSTRLPVDAEFDFAFSSESDSDENAITPFDAEFDFAMLPYARPEPEIDLPTAVAIGDDLANTLSFYDTLAERAAASQGPPLMESRKPSTQQRQVEFSTSQVFGPAGESTVITLTPQCVFRIEKLMATDTGSIAGMGTAIVQIAVGQRVQRPGNTAQGSLTQFFASTALATGIKLDTAHPWEAIAITVKFLQSCSFSMVLSGTAEMD